MITKLLLVDDDAGLRETLALYLGKTFRVLEAGKGPEALELIRRERPPLVLLDVSMPEMSGIEVLEAARILDATAVFVMLSGGHDIEIAKRSLELGASAYITKPFDFACLREELARLMEPPPSNGRDCGRPWRIAPCGAKASQVL